MLAEARHKATTASTCLAIQHTLTSPSELEVAEERSLEAYFAMKSKLGMRRWYSELGLAGQELTALQRRNHGNVKFSPHRTCS